MSATRWSSTLVCLGSLGLTLGRGHARAQELTCVDEVRALPAPPVLEWSWFVGGGGGVRGVGQAGAETGLLRVGGEVDLAVGRIDRPRGHSAVRMGLYALAETTFDGALGEAGVELDLGEYWSWQNGAAWLRVGGGGGAGPWGAAAHLSVTYLVGANSTAERTEVRPCCENLPGSCDVAPFARPHAYTPLLRLFVTLRASLGDDRNGIALIGIEADPLYFADGYRPR